MSNLIIDLYDFLIEHPEYDFIPYSRRQVFMDDKVAAMDDELRDFVLQLMSEWEIYGFRNGFAYGVKLMMAAHI